MTLNGILYLDHNATTPTAPEVVAAMLPFFEREFGNPSSAYGLGQEAAAAVARARESVAALLGCHADEILFTSGGTEGNNTVLKGIIAPSRPGDCHIITSAIEHPAILNPCLHLMEQGAHVTFAGVDRLCRVRLEEIEAAITPRTRLISVMLANNETGTLQPLREIVALARRHGVQVHTDAAQAIGKIPLSVEELGVDFMTLAGHKLYAPKGVGALYIRRGRTLTPLFHGANQEQGRRAGTESVPLLVGLGAACQIARERLAGGETEALARMRDRLEEILFGGIPGLVLDGDPGARLPNTLHVAVPGIEGARILEGIPEILASTGAACHDRSVRLSHVLAAMGVPLEIGMGALRLTLGRLNTHEGVEEAGQRICARVKAMRV